MEHHNYVDIRWKLHVKMENKVYGKKQNRIFLEYVSIGNYYG